MVKSIYINENKVKKIIAIGDIHGCYEALRKLLETTNYNEKEDALVLLGDYIDRGPVSLKVVRYLQKLQKENPNVIALKGNHEAMLLEDTEIFKRDGQNKYGFMKEDFSWLENLPVYAETESNIFVHGGMDLNVDINKQREDTMLWIREDFIKSKVKNQKPIIFGHTPNWFGESYYTSNGINLCIDSACFITGILTSAIIEGGEPIKIVSVNEKETRKFMLTA